jgi:GntR family transcriptional regulator
VVWPPYTRCLDSWTAEQVGYDAPVPLTNDHYDRVNRYDEGGPALHRRVADAIRSAITSGALAPGEELPGEHDMAARFGVNRATVREGINRLVLDGLIVKRSGRPTRVVTPPQIRRMSTGRYQEALDAIRTHDGVHPTSSAFTEDHGVEWTEHNVLADYGEGLATTEEARRLELAGVGPAAPMVLRRRLIKQVRGDTVQLQTSVIPLELVAGSPVADPARQPWPGGTIAELHSVGLVVTRVLEEVQVRVPTAIERKMLNLEVTGPVGSIMEIARMFYVKQRPVEYSVAIVEAARYRLSFETTLI